MNDKRYKKISKKIKELWRSGHYRNRKILKNSGQFKKGFIPWNKGKTRKDDKRIAQSWLGKRHSQGTKDKISNKLKGRKLPIEVRLKISQSEPKGIFHHNWRGGITKEQEKARKLIRYKEWRKAVFERDNYICQKCGFKGGYLEAHHIKEWADYPELRYEVSNGMTLCRDKCHKLKTKKYMKGNKYAKRN